MRPSLPRPAPLREDLRVRPAQHLRLGAQLAAARKERGLTLEAMCRETRLSRQVVQQMEDDAWDALPGDFYARGFVRLYAETVGMDPEAAVDAYDARTAVFFEPDPIAVHEPDWMRQANAPASRGPSPAQLFLLIVTVATIVVFMLGVQRSKRPQQVAANPVVTAPASGATALGGEGAGASDAGRADATRR